MSEILRPPPDSASALADHAERCGRCGATTRLGERICLSCLLHEGLGNEGEPSVEVFARVLGEAEVPDRQWRLGNYEILEEIGRGGMGVIYRARQRHSRRIVALKRVLSYHADSHEALVRFRREAEAAAQLDHPNILPIYEVGESEDGLPFFSMKFATGGSLRTAASRLRSDPRTCVRLMAKVARAIDYAHGQGILHRDLQPGNILLDSHGEAMVSDFGLAKWLAENSDLTQSLTTFGTPGYIAPEQAESAAGNLTPAADVYSLGAVLFSLLANRPPFVGANALSVIRQAGAIPAPKLRSLAPSLDRDLETICARALERDPKARYQSAGDLAEDLERWLEGRPIRARPVPIPARAWRWSRRNPVLAGAALVCFSLGGAVLWLLSQQNGRPKLPPPEKSIAVLPFQNLSQDQENAFFAEGVQDEILTSLAKVADLKVISRTSVMQYKDPAQRNLREIAQQLGVAHVLEGSVQRSANRVRVNAQLIDARHDAHLWAQTYDGDLANVFAIQSQIAKAITAQLQAKISAGEKTAIEQAPTTDLAANALYQQALNLESKPPQHQNLLQAIRLLEKAVARDPQFLLAYCAMSRMHLTLYFGGYDHTPARRDLASRAIENAARLQSDAGEVHLARAHYWFHGFRDYDRARAELDLARRTLPNDPKIYAWTAAIDRRQGRFSEAIRNFERAVELDPRNVESLMNAAFTYEGLRRYPEARQMLDRANAIAPHDYSVRIIRASQPLNQRADARPLRAELDAILAEEPEAAPKIADILFYCAIIERDSAAVARALAVIPPEGTTTGGNFVWPREWFAGLAARTFHDAAAARTSFLAARAILEKIVREQPDYADAWGLLARADAALGRREEAIREGRRACELLPPSKDAWFGPGSVRNLAWTYAWTGDTDLALEQLQLLRERGIDYGELKLNPEWDSLRSDPRFERLLAHLSPEMESAPRTSFAIPDKSIAVLPFQNLSDNGENSNFGAGIQDDVLTSLAKIHDLKVISRTSVMAYQKPDGRDMRAIGRALGVANILEGSVRRAGNRVLVNVQLIDARNDQHLWAERYDRTVADSIGLQGELATEIAAALKATLAPGEKARLEAGPTTSSEAYVLYLTALGKQKTDEIAAEKLYVQATTLDPKFALAYARASLLNSGIAGYQEPRTRRAKARAQAEEALRLSPSLGEAHAALALCLYWGEKNYDAALKEFEIAAAASPNNAEIHTYVGGIYRRQGRWREATASFERAVSLDPRNVEIALSAANHHLFMRDWPGAIVSYNHLLKVSPDSVIARVALAYLEVCRNGNPAAGRKILENVPARHRALTTWNLAMLERDYAGAEQALSNFTPDDLTAGYSSKEFYAGRTALARGDVESAQRFFATATPAFENQLREDPDESWRHAELGLLYAYLRRDEDAIRESRRAVELEPESQDAFHGALVAANLALVYALVGDQEQAITLLERLLSTPGAVSFPGYPQSITLAELRLGSQWDSLRSDPRFQKILATPEPETILSASH